MKEVIKYVLNAEHPSKEYEKYSFENEEIEVIKEVDYFSKEVSYYWSSKLGCSKNYSSPEECVKETCRRHGLHVNKLTRI